MYRSETPVSKLLVFTLALIAVSISQALSAPALRSSDLSDSVADFRNASFVQLDLSGVNLAHANLAGADMTGAAIVTTALNGADLRRVKGLVQRQLDQACGDAATKVPLGMKVHTCAPSELF